MIWLLDALSSRLTGGISALTCSRECSVGQLSFFSRLLLDFNCDSLCGTDVWITQFPFCTNRFDQATFQTSSGRRQISVIKYDLLVNLLYSATQWHLVINGLLVCVLRIFPILPYFSIPGVYCQKSSTWFKLNSVLHLSYSNYRLNTQTFDYCAHF